MSKLCRKCLLLNMIMILRHSNLRMPEICGKICRIYVACAAYMRHIFCQILYIFPYILPKKVLYILRKFSAINQHS